jgi:hypothetical protein
VKLDVTINKKMTINTGNYSSVQPGVTVTAKDIDVEKYSEIETALDVIAEASLFKQIVSSVELMDAFKLNGINEVLDSLDLNQMNIDLKESIETLTRI